MDRKSQDVRTDAKFILPLFILFFVNPLFRISHPTLEIRRIERNETDHQQPDRIFDKLL